MRGRTKVTAPFNPLAKLRVGAKVASLRLKPSTTSTPAFTPLAVTRTPATAEFSDSPPAFVAHTRKKIVAPAFRLTMTLFAVLAPGTAMGLPNPLPSVDV